MGRARLCLAFGHITNLPLKRALAAPTQQTAWRGRGHLVSAGARRVRLLPWSRRSVWGGSVEAGGGFPTAQRLNLDERGREQERRFRREDGSALHSWIRLRADGVLTDLLTRPPESLTCMGRNFLPLSTNSDSDNGSGQGKFVLKIGSSGIRPRPWPPRPPSMRPRAIDPAALVSPGQRPIAMPSACLLGHRRWRPGRSKG